MKNFFNIFFWTLILGLFFKLHAQDLHVKQGETGQASSDIEYNLNIYPKDATPNHYSNSKAYSLLTYIFGTVEEPSTTSPNGIVCYGSTCSTLVGKLMGYFNIGVMTIGMLYLSYVISMSSLAEGQGGDALSQKYASYLIPFRSALGAAFLIPTSTGYTVLQAAILKIILLGSNAGTFMWHFLESYHSTTGSPIGSENISQSNTNTLGTTSLSQGMVQDLSKVFVCIEYLNTSQGRATVEPDLSNDVQDTAFFSWRLEGEKLTTGIDGDTGAYSYQNCPCGSIDFTNLTDYQDLVVSYASNIRGIINGYISEFGGDFDDKLAESIYENYEEQLYEMSQYLKNDLDLSLLNQAQSNPPQSSVDINSEWLDIPQYFFSLLSPSSNTTLSIDLTEYMNLTYPSTTLGQTVANVSGEVIDFTTYNQKSSSTHGLSLNFSKDSSPAIDDLNDQLNEIFDAGDADDALIKFANFGKNWLKIAMGLLTAALVISIFLNFITGIASDFVPASILGMGIAFFSFLIAGFQVITVIIPIATIFAISMPMTPLITFTSAILTWISQSVIAVFATPLLAIGLISPGDGLGRAASSLFLIISIFLRPMLSVVGLVAGAKLFNIAYYYLTNVYFTAVQDVFTIIGDDKSIIAAIASIMFLYVYAFMMVAACTRCYGLVYMIPDKILTWVSGPAIPSNETSQTISAAGSLISRATEKGTQMNQKLMEGISAMASDRNELFMQKAKDMEKGAFPKDQLFAQRMYTGMKDLSSSAGAGMTMVSETVSGMSSRAMTAFNSTKIGSSITLKAAKLYESASIAATNIKNFPANLMDATKSLGQNAFKWFIKSEKGQQTVLDAHTHYTMMTDSFNKNIKDPFNKNFVQPAYQAFSEIKGNLSLMGLGIAESRAKISPFLSKMRSDTLSVMGNTYKELGHQFNALRSGLINPGMDAMKQGGRDLFNKFAGTTLGSRTVTAMSNMYSQGKILIGNTLSFPGNLVSATLSGAYSKLMGFSVVQQAVIGANEAPRNLQSLSNDIKTIGNGIFGVNLKSSITDFGKSVYKVMGTTMGSIATSVAPELQALRDSRSSMSSFVIKAMSSNVVGRSVLWGLISATQFGTSVSNSVSGWSLGIMNGVARRQIGSQLILGASKAIGDDGEGEVKDMSKGILTKIESLLGSSDVSPENKKKLEKIKPWIGNKEYADKLEPWLTEEGLITVEQAIERQAEGRERDFREEAKEQLKAIGKWLNSLISKKM